jgi:hypothetical protein
MRLRHCVRECVLEFCASINTSVCATFRIKVLIVLETTSQAIPTLQRFRMRKILLEDVV